MIVICRDCKTFLEQRINSTILASWWVGRSLKLLWRSCFVIIIALLHLHLYACIMLQYISLNFFLIFWFRNMYVSFIICFDKTKYVHSHFIFFLILFLVLLNSLSFLLNINVLVHKIFSYIYACSMIVTVLESYTYIFLKVRIKYSCKKHLFK